MSAAHPEYPQARQFKQPLRFNLMRTPGVSGKGMAGMPYQVFAGSDLISEGVMDASGVLSFDHEVVTHAYRVQMSNGVSYRLPVPDDYNNPEQAQLANDGMHHCRFESNPAVNQPSSRSDHRTLYASLLTGSPDTEEKQP